MKTLEAWECLARNSREIVKKRGKTMKKFTVDEKIYIPEFAGEQWGVGLSKRKFNYNGDVPGRQIQYKCTDDGRLYRRSHSGNWASVNLAHIANFAVRAHGKGHI